MPPKYIVLGHRNGQLSKLGLRSSIIFDVQHKEDANIGSLNLFDKFRGEGNLELDSYELEITDDLIRVDFTYNGKGSLMIVIIREKSDPEVIVLDSSFLEVWLPSQKEVDPYTVAVVKELMTNMGFHFELYPSDVEGEIIVGKHGEFCAIEINE